MRLLALLLPCALFVGCSSMDRGDLCACPCPSATEGCAHETSSYVEEAHRLGDGNGAIWTHLSATYDVDHDGMVAVAEYPRGAETFRRLDHDGDGFLTAKDFEGPTSMEAYLVEFLWRRLIAVAPEVSPTADAGDDRRNEAHIEAAALARAFDRADTNANGRLGERELLAALRTPDGAREITLSSFKGVRPVVLIFGSYTCPPFRFSATRLREIAETYSSKVQFLFVYIREEHALDGPAPMPSPTQPVVEEPVTIEERRTVASSCRLDLGFDGFPTLVDGIGNEINRAYAAAPARIYVVGKDGRVAYQGGPGPFGLDPDGVEAAIRRELAR